MDYVRVKKNLHEDRGICNSGVLRPCGHLQFSTEETATVVGEPGHELFASHYSQPWLYSRIPYEVFLKSAVFRWNFKNTF